MIYEINGKPYIKVENYYAEVEIFEKGQIRPKLGTDNIYTHNISNEKIKQYESVNEYEKNHNSKTEDFEKTEIKRKNKIL